MLVARAFLARIHIVVVNVIALLGAVIALIPLLIRRRPLGHRTHLPRQVARVIPLERRRRTARRSC